jgi:hypothetical protein
LAQPFSRQSSGCRDIREKPQRREGSKIEIGHHLQNGCPHRNARGAIRSALERHVEMVLSKICRFPAVVELSSENWYFGRHLGSAILDRGATRTSVPVAARRFRKWGRSPKSDRPLSTSNTALGLGLGENSKDSIPIRKISPLPESPARKPHGRVECRYPTGRRPPAPTR